MATYAFETITAEQARNIATGDYLTFAGSAASHTTVLYSPYDLTVPAHISVTHDGRTVLFGTELADLSLRGAIEFADHSRLLIGNEQANTLTGSDGADALYGGAGDDVLKGGAGDDFLQGNSGDDIIDGGAGRNTLYGGQGDDVIYISPSQTGSWAQGNMGADSIYGGLGNDTMYGGQGNDELRGNDGDDWVIGDLGDDDIMGGVGDDVLLGGAGNDTIDSGGGGDYLYGDEGNDVLIVSGHADNVVMVDGDDGRDTVILAGQGKAIVFGGADDDRFEIIATGVPSAAGDWDEIRDWSSSETLHFGQVSIYDAGILPRAYSEFAATSYAEAVSIANEHISATGAIYVVAQVGGDLFVFAETDGNPADGADAAVMLAGRTLADIAYSNFV